MVFGRAIFHLDFFSKKQQLGGHSGDLNAVSTFEGAVIWKKGSSIENHEEQKEMVTVSDPRESRSLTPMTSDDDMDEAVLEEEFRRLYRTEEPKCVTS